MKDLDTSITKLRNLIRSIRLSPLKLQQLEELHNESHSSGKYLKPTLDVSTRWNSTFEMLRRAIHMRRSLTSMSDDLTLDDWLYFEHLHGVLLPFYECTLFINGDDWATLSLVLPMVKQLMDHLDICIMDSSTENNLIDGLLAGRTKLASYVSKFGKIHVAATVLDPRFKMDPSKGAVLPY